VKSEDNDTVNRDNKRTYNDNDYDYSNNNYYDNDYDYDYDYNTKHDTVKPTQHKMVMEHPDVKNSGRLF
jgi:hypothetical protein